MEYEIQDVILLFFVYAFLGWCGEVAFAACKNGRFVNRGFLNGPICPIYGFGVLIVALALRPWEDNLAMLYFGSAVLTTLLELVTGWALEKLFHTRWWNYSKMPLNIGGYVCLPFSFLWGAACVVILKWIHAPLFALVRRLPKVPAYIVCGIFCAAFVADLAATLVSIRRLNQRLSKLSDIAAEMRALSDNLGEDIAERTLAAKERVETIRERTEERVETARERVDAERERLGKYARVLERMEAVLAKEEQQRAALGRRFAMVELELRRTRILKEKPFGHRRLLDAFPNMVSLRHGEALAQLKEALHPHSGRNSKHSPAPERGARKGSRRN